MPKSDTDTGALSMKELEPRARGADVDREEAERRALHIMDGRSRRRLNRTEPVSLKTTPQIKRMMLDMADAEGTTYTEIFEDAILRRHDAMKGKKG